MVALFNSSGHMLQQVRYDPYGVPFGISKADINGDGVLDSNDSSLFVTLYNSGSGTHPFADWNLDGSLSSLDLIAFGNSYNADAALGYGVLSYEHARAGGTNRKAYAGYELAPELSVAKPCLYHVRHRVYDASLGRWTRRDPLGYVDGMSLYAFVGSRPLVGIDPFGLATTPGGGGGCGSRCGSGSDRNDTWDYNLSPTPQFPSRRGTGECQTWARALLASRGYRPNHPCFNSGVEAAAWCCRNSYGQRQSTCVELAMRTMASCNNKKSICYDPDTYLNCLASSCDPVFNFCDTLLTNWQYWCSQGSDAIFDYCMSQMAAGCPGPGQPYATPEDRFRCQSAKGFCGLVAGLVKYLGCNTFPNLIRAYCVLTHAACHASCLDQSRLVVYGPCPPGTQGHPFR